MFITKYLPLFTLVPVLHIVYRDPMFQKNLQQWRRCPYMYKGPCTVPNIPLINLKNQRTCYITGGLHNIQEAEK